MTILQRYIPEFGALRNKIAQSELQTLIYKCMTAINVLTKHPLVWYNFVNYCSISLFLRQLLISLLIFHCIVFNMSDMTQNWQYSSLLYYMLVQVDWISMFHEISIREEPMTSLFIFKSMPTGSVTSFWLHKCDKYSCNYFCTSSIHKLDDLSYNYAVTSPC